MAVRTELAAKAQSPDTSSSYAWSASRVAIVMMTLAACLLVGGILTACSPALSATRSSHSDGGAPADAGGSSWQNPIDGVAVASLPDAQQDVDFPLVTMPNMGSPSTILVTPNESAADTVVVLQYQSSSSGLINVYEEATTMSSAEFQNVINSWVALNGQANTTGSSTAVTLSNGLPGLITTTSDGSNSDIRWIQGAVEYTIRGPSLTQQSCTTFANSLAGAVSAAG